MTIDLVNAPTWSVGEELTSAQLNDLDEQGTFALDKRASETDTLESVVSLAGAGRVVDTVAIGANADTAYVVDADNRVIRVTSAVGANRAYTLSATGAINGDKIAIYVESSFVTYEIAVKDQAAATMYTLGNLSSSDGTWAEFIYYGGWRVHRAGAPKVHSQTFLANGTFTVPAGVFYLDVEGCGAGGGGAAGDSSLGTTTSRYGTGGGGGAGALLGRQGLAVTPGAVLTVTIPAGGIAGTDGGDTSIDTITFAGGGKGLSGVSGASTVFALGGFPVRLAAQPFVTTGTTTTQIFPGIPASGGYGTTNVYTTHNGVRNPCGGFAAGSGGTYGTDSGAYIGGGSGGGGGAGPYGAGGNGGNGGNGNNAGTGGTGTAGATAAANSGAGGGGGGGLGHGTSSGVQGAGGVGGSGQLTVKWVK